MPPLTPPPDPHPRKPKLVCPPGSVDCQVHLFGPKERYPFDPGSRYVSEDALPETMMACDRPSASCNAMLVSGSASSLTYLLPGSKG